MITGLHIGFGVPNRKAAEIALNHAFSYKVEYCREYGVEIKSSDWPCVGIPASIGCDSQEMMAALSTILPDQFGVNIKCSPFYRLRSEHFQKQHLDPMLAMGSSIKNLNGTLSLNEFTKMLILSILNKNNAEELPKYNFAEDMPKNLQAVPRDLWHWGIKNRMSMQLSPSSAKL